MRRAWLLAVCLTATPLPVGAAGTDLIEATKRQDVAAVRAQLARKADVQGTEADGSTALHWAAQRDSLPLVDLLLKAGARATAATRYHVTPLYLAANNGNAAIVERLLDAGADPNDTAFDGQTMLMTAARAGKADAVRLLLTRGATVDAVEPYKGQTALMWAAAEGNTAVVNVLLEAGARLDRRSTGGLTPFLFAVRNAQIETAVTLLAHGADVNDRAPDGSSALSMATVNAYFELAAVLLDRGADPNLPDPRGSPLHATAWLRKPGADGAAGVGNTPQGTPVPTGRLSALDLARALLEHGANPNARIDWREPTFGKEGGTARNPPNIRLGRHLLSYNGATPFYVAAKNGDIELMRLLVEFKADPTIPSRFGVTPLMVAAGLDYWEGESPGPFTGVPEAERLDAVKYALALGNDINAHAVFGSYPMTGDTAYTLLYYPHNIDDLLELGVGDPRWSGSTALIGAVVSGQPSIVQYLVDHGADARATTSLGWTPLAVAEGVFFANAKKEFPQAAAILRQALQQPPAGAAAAPSAAAHATYLDAARVAAGGTFVTAPHHSVQMLRRTAPGQAEVHARETDIFYIVDGEATFITGGTVVDGKETQPDQIRGASIEGGETYHLKKGDAVVVPAGVPHWFTAIAQPISYFTVKVIQ